MKLKLINFVLFQIGWFACVWSAAHSTPLLGAAAVILISSYHLALTEQPRQEIILLVAAALIGLVWESLLVWHGVLVFNSGMIVAGMAPYWIVAMWVLFATTLNLSLRWLKDRLLLSILFGALGGPLAYFAGARLGAVTMPDQWLSLAIIGIGWAVLTPVLIILARRFDGFVSPVQLQRVSYV
jgi:hypothetical protein